MLVAMVQDGALYAVHGGHLGQPLLATGAAGLEVWNAEFAPYGGSLPYASSPEAPELRFPGQWADGENGLYQNWHRDYDPSLGRYIEADPLGLAAGQSLYGYVGSDPVNGVDPTGLVCRGEGNLVACSPSRRNRWPSFSFDRPKGWPDLINPDTQPFLDHSYSLNFSRKGDFDIKCLQDALAANPTPGADNVATRQGSAPNDALPGPMNGNVTSYRFNESSSNDRPNYNNDIVVNVTNPDHDLRSGFVARRVVRTPNGARIETYGEGNSLLQAPISPTRLLADPGAWLAWRQNANEIFRSCTCGQ